MTHSSALTFLVWALCANSCEASSLADTVPRSLRGHRRSPDVQHDLALAQEDDLNDESSASFDDLESETASSSELEENPTAEDEADAVKTKTMAPLYDDFLDIVNNAAQQALSPQRVGPAYEDFLNIMKHSADKAYKEQAAAPSYDEFLHVMKDKTDEAYQQMPSYDDFVVALKVSSSESLKVPVPSYEDFLSVLKVAAEHAMQDRVKREIHGGITSGESQRNPFKELGDRFKKTAEKAQAQTEGKKTEEDEHKLREELKELKRKQEAHEKAKGPLPDHVKRPLMKRINVLRTQLCWKRPNLWQHEKCLRFLGLHCLQESTGEGICRAFAKEAKQRCETSNDPHWKEDYCALSEALSDTYGEDEENVEKEQTADDEVGTDAHTDDGDVVGSDEDLDKELAADDKKMAENAEHPEGAEGIVEDDEDDVIEETAEPKAKGVAIADKDGDGVADKDDAFPDDPTEWRDTDGDGVGDNKDVDLDGDGHNNNVDRFPTDPKEWKDTDLDGIGDNSDDDRDNDGVANDKDKFPDDPTEWADSDGDGVGDNKDAFPFNPNCHRADEPCLDLKKHAMPKPGSPQDPATLDMDAKRDLPDQGYNEHMTGLPVHHDNYYTWVSDWQEEFPFMEDSERGTLARICSEHPQNSWCRKFKQHDAHFR